MPTERLACRPCLDPLDAKLAMQLRQQQQQQQRGTSIDQGTHPPVRMVRGSMSMDASFLGEAVSRAQQQQQQALMQQAQQQQGQQQQQQQGHQQQWHGLNVVQPMQDLQQQATLGLAEHVQVIRDHFACKGQQLDELQALQLLSTALTEQQQQQQQQHTFHSVDLLAGGQLSGKFGGFRSGG